MIEFEINTDALSEKVSIDGVEYNWHGGFGAVIKSYERGRKVGDLRSIGNIVFKVSYIHGNIFRREVCWIPVEKFTLGWVRRFKIALFSIETREVFLKDD